MLDVLNAYPVEVRAASVRMVLELLDVYPVKYADCDELIGPWIARYPDRGNLPPVEVIASTWDEVYTVEAALDQLDAGRAAGGVSPVAGAVAAIQ